MSYYYAETKDTSVSFRTFQHVNEKIESLAERIKSNRWKLGEDYTSPIRRCDSKSGLISELLMENITLQEIHQELKKLEDKNESN